MGKRSEFERIEKDFYRTIDQRAIAALFTSPGSDTRFCEPCAGAGDLVRSLEEAGHKCVETWDIEPQPQINGLIVQRRDATMYGPTEAECYITNPPWSRPILHFIIENLARQKPTWLLFDSDWAFTKQSAPYMKELCTDIVAVGRLIWILARRPKARITALGIDLAPIRMARRGSMEGKAMDFEDEFITQQMDALEHEALDPEIVAEFMRELTYLTRKYGVEIASFDDINPFLVKTDCRDGTYTLDDDDELMGLFYVERSMMQ